MCSYVLVKHAWHTWMLTCMLQHTWCSKHVSFWPARDYYFCFEKKEAAAVFLQVPKSVSVLSNAATYFWSYGNNNNITTCSATNVSAWQTMKGAAKCNIHCELHLSAHQKDLRMYASLLDTIASYCASRFICISCSFTLYGVCTMCTTRQTGTDLLAHSC